MMLQACAENTAKANRFVVNDKHENVTISVIDTLNNNHSVLLGRPQDFKFLTYASKALNFLSAVGAETSVSLDDFLSMKYYYESYKSVKEWAYEKFLSKEQRSSVEETVYRHEAY